MSRKREKPYHSRHALSSIAKRRRPSLLELPDSASRDAPATKHSSPAAVLVIGLSPECSVLDVKSRFEIYGCISRIRIDRDGVGYITFRSKDSADAAITASLDPFFGITIDSKRVLFQLPLLPFSIRAVWSPRKCSKKWKKKKLKFWVSYRGSQNPITPLCHVWENMNFCFLSNQTEGFFLNVVTETRICFRYRYYWRKIRIQQLGLVGTRTMGPHRSFCGLRCLWAGMEEVISLFQVVRSPRPIQFQV